MSEFKISVNTLKEFYEAQGDVWNATVERKSKDGRREYLISSSEIDLIDDELYIYENRTGQGAFFDVGLTWFKKRSFTLAGTTHISLDDSLNWISALIEEFGEKYYPHAVRALKQIKEEKIHALTEQAIEKAREVEEKKRELEKIKLLKASTERGIDSIISRCENSGVESGSED